MAHQNSSSEQKPPDPKQNKSDKSFSRPGVLLINMIVISILVGSWYFNNHFNQESNQPPNQLANQLQDQLSASDLYQKSFLFFGTAVEVQIFSDSIAKANEAFNQIETLYQTIHQNWHAWEKGALLDKINQAIRNDQAIEVEKTVADLIKQAIEISELSDGFFNPAIGGLVDLWGFHGNQWQDNPVIPDQSSIDAILSQNPQMSDLEIKAGNQPNLQSIASNNQNLELDMGAIAKGYAIDLAINQLKEQGIKSALVNAGGDLKILGIKLNGANNHWQVGIRDPFTDQPIGSVDLGGSKDAILFQCQDGCAIASSGSSERFFIKDGVYYSHIINPKTGYPASDFAQVSVVHPSALFADAAATAIFVAGEENFQKVAEQLDLKAYLIINQQGSIVMSYSMSQIFQSIE